LSGSYCCAVAVAALILSIASILVTVVAVYFGKRSADAATTATNIERERRHAEMRPRYLVTCDAPNPGTDQRRLYVKLAGPGELGALDQLTVTIRDDSHFRLKPAPAPGQPPESVPDQVWGPLRFVPGTGPGTLTRPAAFRADAAGRATTSAGLPVGEEHIYALEMTYPPPGWGTRQLWVARVGSTLRLRVESRKEGWDPWIAVGEINVADARTVAEIT
jgi:hypothetical protein